VQKVENEKLLKSSTKNAFLVGYQLRGGILKLFSPTHKNAVLIGYHLKSLKVSGQISLLIGYHLKKRKFNPMVKKRLLPSATT
jgi:hypothetical protein